MNLLSIENLTKTYGERILFDKVTFGIEDTDKIGLIGVNGTGKSTFLQVIAGQDTADSGTVTKGQSVSVEFLPQNPEFDTQASVLEQVFAGSSAVMKVLRDYEQTLELTQRNPDHAGYQKQLIGLSQQMDTLDAWQLESEAKTILTKLGIDDFSAIIGNLSGGQRKRVALARALIHPADLLILDEPTNHLDNDTVEWLEEYLHKRKGALLMITHDRYFLDRVANRMIELDKGTLYSYTGNYSSFLQLKAEREEQREASENKRQNLLRNELAWIKRGAKARTTKQKARIDRFEQLNAIKPYLKDSNLEITAGASRLGRKIIELTDVYKAFNNKPMIQHFNYIVLKDDRVGIIGANGSGKSTLLNIIAGKIAPDSGQIEIGQTVKIGYFSQENGDMDQAMRVIDYIKEEANFITTADGGMITATQLLERFLFSPTLQWMPISKLSGGEKRRLYLLKILMSAPNVLLLDEPTNDLDIQTLTILEDYLDGFPGALIVVSHDRYFLDRLVDKVFAFEGDKISLHNGGYTEYQESVRAIEPVNHEKSKQAISQVKAKDHPNGRSLKFTFAEQREFEQIDDLIAQAEQELSRVQTQIDLSGSDFEALQQLVSEQKSLEGKLDHLLERWTYLNELAEKINTKL